MINQSISQSINQSINQSIKTRKLCYRKDDRAMRPIYECLSCLFTESDYIVKLNRVFLQRNWKNSSL